MFISRREFLTRSLATSAGLLCPGISLGTLPDRVQLNIGESPVNLTGRNRQAVTVNGSLPAPLLRWREGDTVTIRVHNHLHQTSSIHWHGIVLPSEMDGVPGLSFAGIPPGGYYDYRFKLRQSGTYWYHGHSGFQEQRGLYGAIIVDPLEPEPFHYDREHVLLLSDWSDEDPRSIFGTLKKNAHIYNRNRRTLGDLVSDLKDKGLNATFDDREMWNRMRMRDSDLADVSGYTYTFLLNGMAPGDHWSGMFRPGETVRLRVINGSAMSIFDLRIPGVEMKVISADGQPVEPVTIDEFRLAPAETLDVLVRLTDDSPYTIFAQSIDRSGYALGVLTPRPGLAFVVPDPDPVPRLSHADMGMGGHGGAMAGGHHQHHHKDQQGMMVSEPLTHVSTEFGPHVDMRAESVSYRLDDPGVGLRNNGRRVLTYADLVRRGLSMWPQDPDEELTIHLTGNMSRYMWSMDGIPYADADPILWKLGHRYRVTLVNDTMMNHPIHLHGLWSELETGDDGHLPAKHTVVVQPGAKITYRVMADTPGRWAYHCHMLYHMMGMFREVRVA